MFSVPCLLLPTLVYFPAAFRRLREIDQSVDVIYELSGRKVVAVGPYAVKYGLKWTSSKARI